MILNIIVLFFEILYYSMFMYYSKKEGNYWRYFLLFSLISFIGIIIGNSTIYSYLILVLMILYGIKFIVKVKTSLYDMLIIIIMLFIKIILEAIFAFSIYYTIKNRILLTFAIIMVKTIFILIFRNKFNKIYNFLKIKWDNNNFYIRYIFSCFSFIYLIITIVMLIIDKW